MPCTYYSFKSNLFGGDYWCDKKNVRVDNDTYYKYCRGYSYGECPIYRQSNSSGCFITTVVCDILGKKDDDKILNNLRSFRDNILQQDSEYYNILKDYDNIGPVLADAMENDKDKVKMATFLFNTVIMPINSLIENKQYEQACEKYYLMTLALINYYGLKHEYNNDKDNDYGYLEFNPKTAGHGRVRVKDFI